MNRLFLSNQLDVLVDRLCEEFNRESIDPIKSRTILVPNRKVGDWLLFEIAKRNGIAICLKIIEPEALFPNSMSSTALFCEIFKELETSENPDLIAYLRHKPKRQIGLAKELTSLFQKYSLHEKALFEDKADGFQKEILQKIFPSEKKLALIQQDVQLDESIICFGVDYLPPIYWRFLFTSPSLSIYLFSPCALFWEDVRSDSERKSLNRYWKKLGVTEENRTSLDAFLKEAPRNLANWGKLGRETLTVLDSFELHSEELHTQIEPNSLLKTIQSDLLNFEKTDHPSIDDSIQIFMTGSSKLHEIEVLKREILKLDYEYHEIAVYAPDIEPYVPLIEYVFSDHIPYRISGFDITPQSSYRQGLLRLLSILRGRWDVEDLLSLFETPAFYRKLDWDVDTLLTIRSWIEHARVQWGLTLEHRNQTLSGHFGKRDFEDIGSWERGLDYLLETLIYEKEIEVDADLFETLISIIESLKNLRSSELKTLQEWARIFERISFEFLSIDPNDEADSIAQTAFHLLLKELKENGDPHLFPIDVIEHLLIRPHFGQIHASHMHAVRFSSIHLGIQPAKAVFLIGMDEEVFPTKFHPSSLDLLKKVPDQSDRDRYFFLQAIFSSLEVLRISFGHLSPEEGKPVGPSLVVQDLLNVTGPEILKEPPIPPQKQSKKRLVWPRRKESSKPEGTLTIQISDLKKLARDPWDFYLQKVHEIYLDKTLEESFALEKAKLLRQEPIEPPLGSLGKALAFDALEKKNEFEELIQEWQVCPFSLELRESACDREIEQDRHIYPPIELKIDNLTVKLVGRISEVTEKGILSFGNDTIGGTLKVWPEALIAAICLDAPNILILKTGKMKSFQDPRKHLEAFIEYYFESLRAPSPLIRDWADAFLRKGLVEAIEKAKMKGFSFKDPVFEWVNARRELPSAKDMLLDWGPIFEKTFSELASLYPVRGAK